MPENTESNTGNTVEAVTGAVETVGSSNNPIINTEAEVNNNTPAESLISPDVKETNDNSNTGVIESPDSLNSDNNEPLDYGFTIGKFDTDESIKEYTDFANSIGLSKEQADAIKGRRDTGKASKAESNSKTSIEGIDRLKREYGDSYENSINTAKDIVGKLGIDFETMKTLEGQLGTYEVLSLFTKLGHKLSGETKFTTGDRANTKSVENRIEDLRNDREFMASYNDEGSRNYLKHRTKMTELYEKLYPS